jgi:hypothetical protein
MPAWVKFGLLAVVMTAILYVLISPLPELDGTLRSTLPAFALALCWSLFRAFVVFFFSLAALPLSSSVEDILKKTCARLC